MSAFVLAGLSVSSCSPDAHGAVATPAPRIAIRPADGSTPFDARVGLERLVYSNTLGDNLYTFGTSRVADDLYLTSSDGCSLVRLEFLVRGDPAANIAYAVDFAFYDRCPNLGGQIIAGTEGRATVPDGQSYWVTFEPPPEADVPLPRRLWLGLSFTRPDAGWVGGAPALVGFTDNLYANPFFGCGTSFGPGYPADAYGGFAARVFVREPCQPAFYGYRGGSPELSALNAPVGSLFADDIQLNVDGCSVLAYEVGVRGFGAVHFDLRLDAGGLPGEVIPDTELDFSSFSNALQFARRSFDPPLAAPGAFWLTLMPNSGVARVMRGRAPPNVGTTATSHARFQEGVWVLEQGLPDDPFTVSILCAGDPPVGACCDMNQRDEADEAVCREVAEINCHYPPRGSGLLPAWRTGEACSPDPFDLPCGTAACCRADGVCENVTRNECFRDAVTWTQGVYCDALPFACPDVCFPNEGSCGAVHSGPGCRDPYCCAAVCARPSGDFCCNPPGFWDQACVDLARVHCNIPPPNDECAPQGELDGATLINMPGGRVTDNSRATENDSDPGFCCHNGLPGKRGVGTVWYKFVATGPVAELTTCRTTLATSDALILAFHAGDPSTPESACASLEEIGCNDDGVECSNRPLNSRLCLGDLIAGETYYVMVAAKQHQSRGSYALDISTRCDSEPPGECPCASGEVSWLNPPDGAVDARIPHPADAIEPVFGLTAFTTRPPDGSDRLECWTVCESPPVKGGNAVVEVVPGTDNVGTVLLARPPAPGSATTVVYLGAPLFSRQATIHAHPGNVNGDGFADALDATALFPVLEGTDLPLWDVLSADIDRSGRITPLDLLEEMNLLNGAEEFSIWNGSPKPTPVQVCE